MKNTMLMVGIFMLVLNGAAFANPTTAVGSRYDTNITNGFPVEFTYKINGVLTKATMVEAKDVTGQAAFPVTHYMNPIQPVKTISGSVESINTGNNTIVVKDLNEKHSFVIGLQAGDIASLNKGDMVQATLKCVGSNFAVGIQK